ncbi:MAG: neutral/alkaline non-lysosomal ceramidase N-terminal domain-containing protein [Clostridiales bacterium]|jgi:hypothetical protein|nr:neutral/alkaline non-lysosomal ceramidase N-terminal domain-containing protein [Clostridiales bacterium]
MSNVKLGYSSGIITPDLGIHLAGYATDSRRSTGVHDDLHTRVICLEKDEEDFLIIQNEMIGVDYAFSDRVKDTVKKYGISPLNVFVGVTHTHSGPKGIIQNETGEKTDLMKLMGLYNDDMCAKMIDVIEENVRKALENKSPCSIRYGFTKIEGVGLNRNNKDLPFDDNLLAMEFLREDGKRVLLYNMSCHPTVMRAENTLYSADWPCGVTKLAEGIDYDMVMFINGSAGDVSTRFTRQSSTFDELERVGGIVYAAVKKALNSAKSEEITELKAFAFTHKMALRNFGSTEEAQEKFDNYMKALNAARDRGEAALRPYESKVEGAAVNLVMSQITSGGKDLDMRLQVLRLNDFVFVFAPSELFSALTLPVRNELGLKMVFCTYFNGNHGYITDMGAFDNETYEAMSSRFERGEGEGLIARIREEVLKVLG